MFNQSHKPTDFIVVVRTHNGRPISLFFEDVTSDEKLSQEISKIKSEFNFTVITTYPVLAFDITKPNGKGFW